MLVSGWWWWWVSYERARRKGKALENHSPLAWFQPAPLVVYIDSYQESCQCVWPANNRSYSFPVERVIWNCIENVSQLRLGISFYLQRQPARTEIQMPPAHTFSLISIMCLLRHCTLILLVFRMEPSVYLLIDSLTHATVALPTLPTHEQTHTPQ